MTIDELTVGITVDLSGLRQGLARAQEQVTGFGEWLGDTGDALAASAEPFVQALTSGTSAALRDVKAAGDETAAALQGSFAQALVGMVSGAEQFREFWRGLWHELLRIVLGNLTAMVSESHSAAAVMQRALGGLLGGFGPAGIVGGVLGLLGFGSPRRQPQTHYTVPPPEVPATYGALPSTASTAAKATRILSVVLRVESGAVQLSPAQFDAESARQAARSLFDEVRHLFETEDLAEGLASA